MSPSGFQGSRAEKSLALSDEFSQYQRAWFSDLRASLDDGDQFAVINADAPQELFQVFGIPYVVAQWWSSLVAAKQRAPVYLDNIRALGYPVDQESYTAISFGSSLEADPEAAPWGGLPTPTILHAVASGDVMRKLYEGWSQHTGAELLLIERSNSWADSIEPDWWIKGHDDYRSLIERDRLALMTAELAGVIRFLEQRTGRPWSEPRFREVMTLVNEQETYYLRTRDLIAAARPAPVSIVDTMPATMIPQWHRGSEWGRDAARRLYEAVAERVQAGEACYPAEQVRLMWLGRGLWFNMGFYEAFHKSHGAVFVWSMYLSLAADGYIRRFGGAVDPLEALAARFVTMGDELRSPTWASEWHLKEALSNGIDGVVSIEPVSYFDRLAFQRAGIPVLELGVSNVDPRRWDDDEVRAAVSTFIDTRAAPVAARRRARETSSSVSQSQR